MKNLSNPRIKDIKLTRKRYIHQIDNPTFNPRTVKNLIPKISLPIAIKQPDNPHKYQKVLPYKHNNSNQTLNHSTFQSLIFWSGLRRDTLTIKLRLLSGKKLNMLSREWQKKIWRMIWLKNGLRIMGKENNQPKLIKVQTIQLPIKHFNKVRFLPMLKKVEKIQIISLPFLRQKLNPKSPPKM